MRKYYQSVFALITLSMNVSQSAEQEGIALVGNPVWDGNYTFRIPCRDGQTLYPNIEFVCQNKTPVHYILLSEEKFPLLYLENPLSCQTYVQNVSHYFSRVRVARCDYVYQAIVNGKLVECRKRPVSQENLWCRFDSLKLKPNYDFQRIELDSLSVQFIDNRENSVLMDVASKMKDRFGLVRIPLMRVEGQSNMDYIVSTSGDLTGRVYDATGCIHFFRLPAIPGVVGFEANREARILTYRKGETVYEDALASRIRPARVAEEILYPIGLENLQTSSSSYSSISSSSSMSMEGGLLEPENRQDQGADLYIYFQLGQMGGSANLPERRVLSPYIYNNGTKLFLTQTIEQDCQLYVNGVADEDSSWVLTYTILTPYPVQVPGFSPTLKATGLYQLDSQSEDKWWLKLDNAYEVEDMFTAQRQGSHGSLTQAVRSQPETYDLKTTWTLAGLDDYVELEGQKKYQWLVNRFRTSTEGMLKVIKDIPEIEAHAILPFLLSIRHRPDLKEPALMGPQAYDRSANANSYEWNFQRSYDLFNYTSLQDAFARMGHVYSMTILSFRCLPLLTSTEQHSDRRMMKLFTEDKSPKGREEGRESFYPSLAVYLNLDRLKHFEWMPFTRYESDRDVTIQPLARCLRHLKNLESLTVARYMGFENMKYLIERGLCQNRSIKELIISNIYGNSPLKLIGELLAKNATIRKLSIVARITDYEAFNELGRGLRMNKTLEELNLNDCSNEGYQDTEQQNINDWVEQAGDTALDARNYKSNIGYSYQRYFVRRPLPGRTERGCTTHDFSEFREAILLSNLKIIYAGMGYNLSDQMALINMLEQLNKPGLEIKIRHY